MRAIDQPKGVRVSRRIVTLSRRLASPPSLSCTGTLVGSLAIVVVTCATSLAWWHGLLIFIGLVGVLRILDSALSSVILGRLTVGRTPGTREHYDLLRALKAYANSRGVQGNGGNEVFSRNVLAKLIGTPVDIEDFAKKLDGALKHFWHPEFELPLEGEEGENECLRSLLAGPPAVRKLAAERLRELGDDSWAKLVTGAAEDFTRVLNTPCGVEILATAFFGEDSSIQMQVVEAATGQPGDGALVLLLTALRRGEKGAREAAAAALINRGMSDVVPELLRQLADGVNTIEAMIVLGRLGDRRATAPLIERLTKGDCTEAATAAEGLGHLGDPAAIGPLTEVLFRSYEDWGKVDVFVRMSVDGTLVKGGAIALSQARDDRHRVGIAMLMGSLANTPREQVGRTRGAACAALARLCDEPTRTELARRVAEELGETPGAEALGIVQATLRAQRDA